MGQSVLKNLLAKSTLSVFNILIPFLILPYVYRVLGPEKSETLNMARLCILIWIIGVAWNI